MGASQLLRTPSDFGPPPIPAGKPAAASPAQTPLARCRGRGSRAPSTPAEPHLASHLVRVVLPSLDPTEARGEVWEWGRSVQESPEVRGLCGWSVGTAANGPRRVPRAARVPVGGPPPTSRKAQRFSQGLTSRGQRGLLAPGRGCWASYRGLVLSAVPASGGWGQKGGGLDPRPPRSSGHSRPCALPSSRPVVPGLHPDHQLEPLHPKAVSAVRHSVRQRADHRPQQQ